MCLNRHKDHINQANTITSVIVAKQTVINEVYVFSIKFRYSNILLRNTLTSFILLINFSGNQKNGLLIGLNSHATELIFSTRVWAIIMELFHT